MRSRRLDTQVLTALAWSVEWLSQMRKILRPSCWRVRRSRNAMNTLAVKRPWNSENASSPPLAIALIMFWLDALARDGRDGAPPARA